MRSLSCLCVLSFALSVSPACTSSEGTDGSGESESASGSSGSGTSGSAESGSGSSSESTSAETTTGDGDGDGDGDTTTTTTGDGDGDDECQVDADCKLQNDCCGCAGHPLSTEIPACQENCLIPFCEAIGITEAACVGGQCTIKKLNCDDRTVTCDGPTPDCGMGTKPLVVDGCWDGSCVPEEACDYVSRCSVCTERELCVTESLNAPGGPWIKCVPIPGDCGAQADCACAGDDYCDDGTFDACSDGDNGITCQCTAC